ncbi:MAG: hypothetical protein NZ898_02790 [Myxococcota bacterium]|nr:hypothetical protein [Myxococcota bacterium]MDW8361300.1 hypothetical protein [Myxococcales bacterium]
MDEKRPKAPAAIAPSEIADLTDMAVPETDEPERISFGSIERDVAFAGAASTGTDPAGAVRPARPSAPPHGVAAGGAPRRARPGLAARAIAAVAAVASGAACAWLLRSVRDGSTAVTDPLGDVGLASVTPSRPAPLRLDEPSPGSIEARGVADMPAGRDETVGVHAARPRSAARGPDESRRIDEGPGTSAQVRGALATAAFDSPSRGDSTTIGGPRVPASAGDGRARSGASDGPSGLEASPTAGPASEADSARASSSAEPPQGTAGEPGADIVGGAEAQAAASLPEVPDRQHVRDAAESVRSAIAACASGRGGLVEIRFVIGSSGRVRTATVLGSFAGSPEGSCMARAAREARFPAFSAESFTVSYPYAL